MTKAEQRAQELYPNNRSFCGGVAQIAREAYVKGCEETREELEPTIEAARLIYEAWNGGTMDDVRREMKNLGELLVKIKEE